MIRDWRLWFFFFNDTATTEIYTLSLHDALPISSLLTFSIGAIFPLLPFLLGYPELWAGLLSGGVGLLIAGVLSSRFTPRPWWFAGLRQLLFGAVAAGATYLIGTAIGVTAT